MKKSVKISLVIILCVALLSCGAYMGFTRYVSYRYKQLSGEFGKTVKEIEKTLPAGQVGTVEKGDITAMPAAEVGGTDYVGVMCIEKTGKKYPVYAKNGDGIIKNYPYAFYGSAKSGNLMIEGLKDDGYFDFLTAAQMGDIFTFTDVYGDCYTYSVKKISHRKTSDINTIYTREYDLSLFAEISHNYYLVLRLSNGIN